MPITSFTGLPGAHKTTLMVEHLLAAAKDGKRPLFAAGIDGLDPGLATVWADPRNWNVHDPDGEPTCDCHMDGKLHAHVIPDGALIYVDEAWKWFGHLHDASRQATPKHVLDLAEHRHRGIDFIWTYQMPNQIYPFARGLCGEHHHIVRRFGTKLLDVYTWGELQEDVKSQAKRDIASRTTRLAPTHVYGKFKSAEVHTIKTRIPLKVLMIPVMLVLAVLAIWFAYSKLKPDNFASSLGVTEAKATEKGSPGVEQGGMPGEKKGPRYATLTDYAKAHLPRFATMPWTAPLFDDREPTADPLLYCLSSLAGQDAQGEHAEPTCTCVTEQGTLYRISQPECRTVARRGPVYNPYRERGDRETRDEPSSALPTAATPPGGGLVVPGDIKEVGTKGEAKAPGGAE